MATRESSANWPARSLGQAAAAIMAALSVERASEGRRWEGRGGRLLPAGAGEARGWRRRHRRRRCRGRRRPRRRRRSGARGCRRRRTGRRRGGRGFRRRRGRAASRGLGVGQLGERGAAAVDGWLHAVGLDVAEDGGLDAAEGEVEGGAGVLGVAGLLVGQRDAGAVRARLDRVELEGHGAGVAVGREGVDPGATGVAEAEQLGDLVVGLAGGVVDGAADVLVAPGACGALRGEVEVGVAAGDDEGEQRELHGGFGALAGLHQDGVDVAFEVIDADERNVEAEGEGLGVGDADEQRAGEAGAFGDGDGLEIAQGEAGLAGLPGGRRGRCCGGARARRARARRRRSWRGARSARPRRLNTPVRPRGRRPPRSRHTSFLLQESDPMFVLRSPFYSIGRLVGFPAAGLMPSRYLLRASK